MRAYSKTIALLTTCVLPSVVFDNAIFGQEQKLYRFGKIAIHRKEIFDSSDSTTGRWIRDLTNHLHKLTKEQTIRSELLFQEGDIYNRNLVEQTERRLRGFGIVGDVALRCDTVAHDTVNITIVTYDKWAMGIDASYKKDGGITSYGLTMKDNNFLGNAQKIRFGYNYASDRSSPYGFEVILNDPHLPLDWWRMTLQYKNSELLHIKTALLERPFYSDTTFWSAGAYADAGSQRVRIFKNSILKQEYDLKQETEQTWGVVSLGSWPKVRLGIAYIRARSEESPSLLRSFDNLDLFNISVSLMNRRYYTTSYLENFGRVEDVPLGDQVNLVIGKNPHWINLAIADYFCRLDWQQALKIHRAWYIGYKAGFSSFLVGRELKDATISFNLVQHWRVSTRNLLAFRTLAILGKNWSPGVQLTLSSPNGLRGYPAYKFSGDRQLLVNLEDRIFSRSTLWIFRFGGVLFFDAGTVWKEGESLSTQRVHSSAGLGLRIENTKQQGHGIIRIDLAFNFDQKGTVQVIFSSDHLFPAFQEMDYNPPTNIH